MSLDDFTQRFRIGNKQAAKGKAAAADLGLGDKVGRKPGVRLINQDGSFNIERRGESIFSPYQQLVEMRWRSFLLLIFFTYLGINVLFALGFLAIGTEHLANVSTAADWGDKFAKAFFFSVQTFTTVGYGAIHPTGIAANSLASITALTGLLSVALSTGLIFARFSQPRDQIIFSANALLAPYSGASTTSLQFRIASIRDNNLINMKANVVLSWLEDQNQDGKLSRRFAPLSLEREFVALFPLNWTIVHPIDENSPIHNWSKADFCKRHSEILIMIEGYDQTYAQKIHANSSYTHTEVLWNSRFQPMYFEEKDQTLLHLDKINEIWEEE